jgi:hypothetical protein
MAAHRAYAPAVLPDGWPRSRRAVQPFSDPKIGQSPPGDAETGRLAVQRLDCPSEKIDITRLARRSIRHSIEIVFVLQGFAKTDGSKVESNLITSWNILGSVPSIERLTQKPPKLSSR